MLNDHVEFYKSALERFLLPGFDNTKANVGYDNAALLGSLAD